MFSSIARSIKSIAKGPRAVLAEKIAQVLSEHFILDPKDVESSLLQDARIVLKNTQLRRRKYRSDNVPNTVVSVSGCVEEVVFSWRWSFSGSSLGSSTFSASSGVVQDVVLAIRGVKAKIRLDAWDALNNEEQALTENLESALILNNGNSENSGLSDSTISSTTSSSSVKEKESFLQKYVQQIVDNLTLKLEDFDFEITVGNGPAVMIAGKDLELGTMSSASVGAAGEQDASTPKKTILSQKISIGSFFVNIQDKSGKSLPLLEPFGYAASVTRFSGERFKGGILSGLEVVGLSEVHKRIGNGQNDDDETTDDGVFFHVGLPQIQTLSALGMMIIPSSSRSAEHTPSEEIMTGPDSSEGDGESSTFHLPLPALTIVLPSNGKDKISTKITLPRANVLYRADGQVFQIEGEEGIKENGTSLIALAGGGKWSVDFVKKIVNLDKDGGGCKISISDESLMRISSSIHSISSTDHITNLKDAWEETKDESAIDDRINQIVASEPWSISTGRVNLQLAGGSNNNWFEANIAHSQMILSPDRNELRSATVGEFTVKSSFDTATAISVPPFTFASGKLHISNTIDAAVSSMEDSLRMKDFLLSFLQPFEKKDRTELETMRPSNNIPVLPCSIGVDELRLLVRESNMNINLKQIKGEGTSFCCETMLYSAGESKVESQNININGGERISLSCESVRCTDGESKVESQNIRVNYQNKSDVNAKFGSVDSLIIPGVFSLNQRIVDTSIVYKNGRLFVDANKIHGTFERPKVLQAKKNDTKKPKITIPFPVQLDLKYLTLKEAGKPLLIGLKQIILSVSQSGSTFAVESREGMKIRLQQSPSLSFDTTMGKLALQLQEDNGSFKAKQISLYGAQLGPCSPSSGTLLVTVPYVTQEDGKKLSFHDSIDMSFDSVEVFDKFRPLFDGIIGHQEGEPSTAFPFPIDIPGMTISASSPPFTMQIGPTSVIGSYISCRQANASVQNSISFSMKGLEVDIASRSLNVDCVKSLQLPGLVELTRQFNNMHLKMMREALFVTIPTPINAKIISKSTGIVPSQTPPSAQKTSIQIPFRVHATLSKANLKTLREGDKRCIQMEEIVLDVSPTRIPTQDILSGEVMEGAKISLGVESIEHEMFQVQKLQSSLMVELHRLETLHQLQLSLRSSRIEAGYSSNDWSSLFKESGPNDGVEQKALKMPFAKVSRASVFISYQGSIVGSSATITVPEFVGHSLTTSNDLSTHYTNAVLERIPGILTNVDILGTNVVDGSFASVGRLALGAKSLAGSGVGSVVGTAAADGVKAAIAAGKSGRNVSADDSYKFGDFTRGVVRGMKHATKKGAQSRGSDGSDYVPGDFTVGAAQSLGEYGGRNSGKLKKAGASGTAATVGFAVAGPLGMLAGAYLGGKLVGGETSEQQQSSLQQQQQQQLDHQQRRQQQQLEHQQRQLQLQQQQRQLPQAALNDPGQFSAQNFTTILQQEQEQRQKQQETQQQAITMAHASLQQQQEIPMVHAQLILDEPVHAEPIMNGFYDGRQQGSQRQHNSNQYQPQQAPQNEQNQPATNGFNSQSNSSQHQQLQSNQNQQYHSQYLSRRQHQQTQAPQNQQSQPAMNGFYSQSNSSQNQQFQASPQYQQVQTHQQHQQQQLQTYQNQQYQSQYVPHGQQQQKARYKFGDLTRGVLAKGKQADGRSQDSGYKFGDFTRGLFK